MMSKAGLTQERLQKLLSYDPETGLFSWLLDVGGVQGYRAGRARVAGTDYYCGEAAQPWILRHARKGAGRLYPRRAASLRRLHSHRRGARRPGICDYRYRRAHLQSPPPCVALPDREWPKDQIDHINLDKADNRFVNLREATPSQNGANTRGRAALKGAHQFKNRNKWNFL